MPISSLLPSLSLSCSLPFLLRILPCLFSTSSFSFVFTRSSFLLFAFLSASAIDCVLSEWSDWTACSAPCGEGTHTRTRRILTAASVDPPGAACGPLSEESKCFSPRGACRQDCEMSEWTSWSSCSQPCGVGGKRLSSRRILKTGGLGGGDTCAGEPLLREEACNEEIPCVSDCEVGEWTDWSGCSASCSERRTRIEEKKQDEEMKRLRGFQAGEEGESPATTERERLEFELILKQLPGGGKRIRTRAILKPPKNGGQACPATEEIDDACNADIPCPIDCTYAQWSEWSPCSVSCGVGRRSRSREITREARFGGKPCDDLDDTIDCMADVLCVDDCEVSEWEDWTACSVTCGGGVRKRRRQVTRHRNKHAPSHLTALCKSQSGWASLRRHPHALAVRPYRLSTSVCHWGCYTYRSIYMCLSLSLCIYTRESTCVHIG